MKKIPQNYIFDVFSRDHALLALSFMKNQQLMGSLVLKTFFIPEL
jgi:hypothetical protein